MLWRRKKRRSLGVYAGRVTLVWSPDWEARYRYYMLRPLSQTLLKRNRKW